MRVYAVVWGGSSYAIGEPEEYRSLRALLEYIDCRYDPYRPVWGEWEADDYCAHVWRATGRELEDVGPGTGNEYPDYVVRVGARGGLHVEQA